MANIFKIGALSLMIGILLGLAPDFAEAKKHRNRSATKRYSTISSHAYAPASYDGLSESYDTIHEDGEYESLYGPWRQRNARRTHHAYYFPNAQGGGHFTIH